MKYLLVFVFVFANTIAQECANGNIWTVKRDNQTFISVDADYNQTTVSTDFFVKGKASIQKLSVSKNFTANENIQQGKSKIYAINSSGDVVGTVDGLVVKGYGVRIFSENQFLDIPLATTQHQLLAIGDYFVLAYQTITDPWTIQAVAGTVDLNGVPQLGPTVTVYTNLNTSNNLVALELLSLYSNRFIISFIARNTLSIIIAQLSGNTVVFGSPSQLPSEIYILPSIAVLSPTKIIFGCLRSNGPPANYSNLVISSDVSGLSLANIVQVSGYICYPIVLPLTSTTFVWIDNFSSAVVATLSGNTLSFGNPVTYPSKFCTPRTNFALNSSHVVLASISKRGFLDTNEFVIAKIQGQTITIGDRMAGTSFVTQKAQLFQNQLILISDGQFSYGFGKIVSDELKVTEFTILSELEVTLLNSNRTGVFTDGTRLASFYWGGSYLGIAKNSANIGQQVEVVIGGISDVHSNLLLGSSYHGYPDGRLKLARNGYEYFYKSRDIITVGRAVSDTEIWLNQGIQSTNFV